MKYENREKVEEILKEIDVLEKEFQSVNGSNKINFLTNHSEVIKSSYWIRIDPSTRQDKAVKEFVDELKSRIQDMINLLKKELEEL
jgi:chaperonin cofactor prefoldin